MTASTVETSVAKQFGLSRAPTLLAKTAMIAPISFTRLHNDGEFNGTTTAVPPHEAFSFQVALAPMTRGDLWIGGRYGALSAAIGDTFVFDLASSTVARLPPPYDYLRFCISTASLDALAVDRGLRPIRGLQTRRVGSHDPVMHGLALTLLPIFQGVTRPSTLFLDSMALAFHAHAIHAYGGAPISLNSVGSGLAPWQMRRAQEFIEENLGGDPSISDLARECRVSASHFARAFRLAAGMPPHRWLLQRRVQRAKEMLLEGEFGLAQIALACGFVDQSHLTRTFTRSEGYSPGKWRRLHRN